MVLRFRPSKLRRMFGQGSGVENKLNGAAVFAARKAMKISQTELAKRVGCSQQLIGQIERGEATSTTYIFDLARELDVPPHVIDPSIPSNLATLDLVPVVGYVQNGNEVHFIHAKAAKEARMQLARAYVEQPPSGKTENTVALEIRTEGLGSFFEGWYAYYDQVELRPSEIAVRGICLIQIRNGPTVIKRIIPGSLANRFHIISQNGGVTENAEVSWVAPVTAICPPPK
jgi:transcriptional regulator with XRE-family HTH domain